MLGKSSRQKPPPSKRDKLRQKPNDDGARASSLEDFRKLHRNGQAERGRYFRRIVMRSASARFHLRWWIIQANLPDHSRFVRSLNALAPRDDRAEAIRVYLEPVH